MGDLADKVKARSPFLKLEVGESIVAIYKGYKMIPSTYDPELEIFRFILQITVDGEVQQKYWDTGANKVAMVFDTLEEGDKVKITKNVIQKGGKEQTSWEVEPVKISVSEEKTTSEDEVNPEDIPDNLGEKQEEIEV